MEGDHRVRSLSGEEVAARAEALGAILLDCIAGGASIGFMAGTSREAARRFFEEAGAAVARGERVLLVAEAPDGTPMGTVQVGFAPQDNQPHRGDLFKMLVARRYRRAGIGAALMAAAEAAALAAGRDLLVLDTGTPEAARLYERAGWRRVGMVPRYALNPDGSVCDTTFYYKDLRGAGGTLTAAR
ncbi:N-acetyltransferase family protein [Salinarimonas sp.]|uniref:GNAT family N-acetyltransferase n=1 Tax=Salinarimonas sp. TaxID=2766526 RepID=UPI0039195534